MANGNEISMNDSLSWYMANVSGYKKFDLKLAYFNINSIANKIDEVKEMLERECLIFHSSPNLKLTLRPLQHYSPNLALGSYRDQKKGAEDSW